MSSQLEKYCRELDRGFPSISKLIQNVDYWGEELSRGGIYPVLQGFWCSRFHSKELMKNDCEECVRLRHLIELIAVPRVVEIPTTPVGFKRGRDLYLDLFSLRYLIERYLAQEKVSGVKTHLRGYLCGKIGHLIYSPTGRPISREEKKPRISLAKIKEVYRQLAPYHYSFASLDLSYQNNPFKITLSSNSALTIDSTRLLPRQNPPSYLPQRVIVTEEDSFYLETSTPLQVEHLITQRLRGELDPVLDTTLNVLITAIDLREHLSNSDWKKLWVEPPLRSEFSSVKRFQDLALQLNHRRLKYINRPQKTR